MDKPAQRKNGRLNGGQGHSTQQNAVGRAKGGSNPSKPTLAPEASAVLRDQLTDELKDIGSAEDAATWAHRRQEAKNSLTAADARHVEDFFQARLDTLRGPAKVSEAALLPDAAPPPDSPLAGGPAEPAGTSPTDGIDKSRLAHPEPRRLRDRDHLKFVAKQPCLICGRKPADPHALDRRKPQERRRRFRVSSRQEQPLRERDEC